MTPVATSATLGDQGIRPRWSTSPTTVFGVPFDASSCRHRVAAVAGRVGRATPRRGSTAAGLVPLTLGGARPSAPSNDAVDGPTAPRWPRTVLRHLYGRPTIDLRHGRRDRSGARSPAAARAGGCRAGPPSRPRRSRRGRSSEPTRTPARHRAFVTRSWSPRSATSGPRPAGDQRQRRDPSVGTRADPDRPVAIEPPRLPLERRRWPHRRRT